MKAKGTKIQGQDVNNVLFNNIKLVEKEIVELLGNIMIEINRFIVWNL